MKIEIKSRFMHEILFSHDCENNSMEITLAAAVSAKANLYHADLSCGDFSGMDFSRAKLSHADFSRGNLSGVNFGGAGLNHVEFGNATLYRANFYNADCYNANFCNATLDCANLYGANFDRSRFYGAKIDGALFHGANLTPANLEGANFGEAGKLVGDRPYFAVGPIGPRGATLSAFLTEKGVYISTSFFLGTIEEFQDKIEEEYGDNRHAVEYRAALVMIKTHYDVWHFFPQFQDCVIKS